MLSIAEIFFKNICLKLQYKFRWYKLLLVEAIVVNFFVKLYRLYML